MEERVADVTADIMQAELWVSDVRLGNQLVLKFDCKKARDEVVR